MIIAVMRYYMDRTESLMITVDEVHATLKDYSNTASTLYECAARKGLPAVTDPATI